MFWLVVGASAAVLTSFSFLPQIIKTVKTRSAKDISVFMLAQFACGSLLWMAYSAHLKDPIIMGANCVTFVSLFSLLILYFLYGRRK